MQFEAYYLPLNSHDLCAISASLRERDVLTPSFASDDVDIYDPITYRREAGEHGTETVLLADRNLVTRWVGLVRGLHPTPEHRLAADLLAFAQCGNIRIEPNIALYEAARTTGAERVRDELKLFRVADNLPTTELAAVALGRADTVTAPTVPPQVGHHDETIDFTMPLRRWRRNYILALRLAALELRGGRSEQRMEELLNWMYSDFLIGGPAVLLAAYYLAPNSARAGLLKNLRSADRKRALNGVRNAAWDLTFLSEWIEHVSRQRVANRLTLLGSFDRSVNALARLAVDSWAENAAGEPQLLAVFRGLWGCDAGRRLFTLLEQFRSSADSPDRQLNRPSDPGFIEELIQSGERVIQHWNTKPVSRSA